MDRCRVAVHLRPRAKVRGVALVDGDTLRVSVTVPAVEGRANEALRTLLPEVLDVARADIELVAGVRSRRKVVDLPLSIEELRRRLGPAG